MSPEVEDFLGRLRVHAGRNVRISAEDYRRIFAGIYPTLEGADFRETLFFACQELAAGGHVLLPKSPQLYDRGGAKPLPAWVELQRSPSLKDAPAVDPTIFPWAPELRFACDLRDARSIDVLLRVHDFLRHGGRQRPLVPAKERSVELFGEEKRLERLKNGALFGPERLSLELLRCYIVLPPLVYELASGNESRPLLVLENYSTYHSFARWNRELRHYSAIVYGGGESFETSAVGLADITLHWDRRVFYFGDLDTKGLLIPATAALTLEETGIAKLFPHLGCYRRLLARATTARLPSAEPIPFPSVSQGWLGPAIYAQVESSFLRGMRIPQELVGWEILSTDGHLFAGPPPA